MAVLLAGFGDRERVRSFVASQLHERIVMAGSPNGDKYGHNELLWPETVGWSREFCDETEYSFVGNYFWEFGEAFSRSFRLEPLKSLAYQDYSYIHRNQYIAICQLLKTEEIDTVIVGDLPHESYMIILAAVCIYRKIRFYALYSLNFCPRFAVLKLEDEFYNAKGLKWDFGLRIKPSPLKGISFNGSIYDSLEEYSIAERHIAEFCLNLDNGGTYEHMKDLSVAGIPSRSRSIREAIMNPTRLKTLVWHQMIHLKQKSFRKEIQTLGESPKGQRREKQFLYFPLHLQPEMTTSALGGRVYNDQAILASQVACIAREYDIDVVIKENPKQSFSHRSPEFIKALKYEPNLYFADTRVSSKDLLDSALAVVTVSGTAGIEGIRRGKRVLCGGTTWYQESELVLGSLIELESFLQTVQNNNVAGRDYDVIGGRDGLEEVANLMHRIASSCWNGCANFMDAKFFDVTEVENDARVAESIVTFLSQGIANAVN